MKNNLLKILEKEIFEDETKEGDLVTFNNTVEDMPLKIDAENGTEIKVCNKNLIDITPKTNITKVCGMDYTCTACSFTLKGTATAPWVIIDLKENKSFFKAGNTYTFSAKSSETDLNMNIAMYINYTDGNRIGLIIWAGKKSTVTFTEKQLQNVSYINFAISNLQQGQEYDLSCTLQLEQNSEATDYIEHQSQTYTSTGETIIAKSYDDITHVYSENSIKATAKISKIRELEDKINE